MGLMNDIAIKIQGMIDMQTRNGRDEIYIQYDLLQTVRNKSLSIDYTNPELYVFVKAYELQRDINAYKDHMDKLTPVLHL